MNDGKVMVPIEFESGEYAGTGYGRFSIDNPAMQLTDPDYLTYDRVSNCGVGNTEVNTKNIPVSVGYGNAMFSPYDDIEPYVYACQKSKNQADLEALVTKEKLKENTVTSHRLNDRGFIRGKVFPDGSIAANIVASGFIVDVGHWIIDGREYAQFLVADITSKFFQKEARWTDVFAVSQLENDKFVENLLSRYFNPTDSRAYNPIALKDFRSRIYEKICSASIKTIAEKTGWYQVDGKRIFYDGADYPNKEHLLYHMRRSSSCHDANADTVLRELCKELDQIDIGNRLSFLIGYGMVSWLSEACFLKWDKYPGILIFGKEDVCRRYASACLKMYTRTEGSDIVELAEMDKRTLAEYVDILKDDVLIMNCNNLSGTSLKTSKAIIAGRSAANHNVNVPIAVFQTNPNAKIFCDNYVAIDLNGFEVSASFCSYMQDLKAILIAAFEAEVVDDTKTEKSIVSYEEAIKQVFRTAQSRLCSMGASITAMGEFFAKLERGVMLAGCFKGDNQEALIYVLKQRMEQLIVNNRVSITGDAERGTSADPKYSLIVRGTSVYIPAKYWKEVLLSLLNLSESDFNHMRDVLIRDRLLDTYDIDSKTYTKKITVAKGERIYAYEFKRELFIPLNE